MAATAAGIIYGINHTIAKGLMPAVIEPHGFILLRVVGAAMAFWVLSLLGPARAFRPKGLGAPFTFVCVFWDVFKHDLFF